MNAWIYSAGKVVKVEGGTVLAPLGSGFMVIRSQTDEVIAAVHLTGDTFVVLSEDQPESGGATGPRIAEAPLLR